MTGDIVNFKNLEYKSDSSRAYVVGDIHGCLEEASRLIDFIVNGQKLNEDDHLIFLGDYIDRGSNSKGVIDYILNLRKEQITNVHCLKGNHEEIFLQFYHNQISPFKEHYLANGGFECIQSYGYVPEDVLLGEVEFEISDEHMEFYNSLDIGIELDKHILVHAGLNPKLKITEQKEEEVLWIRDPFIRNRHNFERIVIFGHTPLKSPYIDIPYKVGIDTGLVYGNMLTSIELRSMKMFHIRKDEDHVMEGIIED